MSSYRSGIAIALLLCWATMPTAAARPMADVDLMSAIRDGDHQALTRALKTGADPNKRLPDGSMPLAWAIEMQDSAAVARLLKHGAAVNDNDAASNPFRPLVVACLHPSEPVLVQLLVAGVDVNVRGPENIPALSLCAAHAPASVVKDMLAAGAAVNVRDDSGQTPLMWAAAHNRIDNFDQLMASGADLEQRSDRGRTAMMFAIKSGQSAIARHVLAAGADREQTTPDGTTLLQLALYQRNFDIAAELVNYPGDLSYYDQNGRQPLHVAVAANQVALARQLLDAGADSNALTTESKIHWRYESNFKAGDYRFPKVPPLLLAAENGFTELLQLLIDAGADPAWSGADGTNVTLAAAASGVPAALAVALSVTGDANVQNERGETPLHRALTSASGPALNAMLEVLSEYGARPDIADRQGRTATEIATDAHFKATSLFTAHFQPQDRTDL